jgi:hypothetical protein
LSTGAHNASADFHSTGGGNGRQHHFLIALNQVIDDPLRVQQLVGGLLAHPRRKARQIVLVEPDRHRQVFVRRAELQLEMLVEAFQQILGHVSCLME